jgi:hypothetical protein
MAGSVLDTLRTAALERATDGVPEACAAACHERIINAASFGVPLNHLEGDLLAIASRFVPDAELSDAQAAALDYVGCLLDVGRDLGAFSGIPAAPFLRAWRERVETSYQREAAEAAAALAAARQRAAEVEARGLRYASAFNRLDGSARVQAHRAAHARIMARAAGNT